jgi:predicted transcriptional regulator
MATTIQISEELQNELKIRKLSENESYEEVIWDMIEDSMELSEETMKAIKRAESDIKAGKVHTLESVKREMNV